MKSESFCYWLQGFFELQNPTTLTPEQVECIKRHLNMVFVHEIDPAMGDKSHQHKLNEIHSPGPNDSKQPYSPSQVNGTLTDLPFNPSTTLIRC